MKNQMSIFDFMAMSPEIGDWTFDDLRSWAESLAPGWHESTWGNSRSLRLVKGKCEIDVHLGQVLKFESDEFVPAIHFNTQDCRNGYSGCGSAYDDVSKCAERVLFYADKFGMERRTA